MPRAERRNISLSSSTVNEFLDRQQNVSKFIENLVLAYIEEQEKEYAELKDLEELRAEFEILNENYTQQRELLVTLSRAILGGK